MRSHVQAMAIAMQIWNVKKNLLDVIKEIVFVNLVTVVQTAKEVRKILLLLSIHSHSRLNFIKIFEIQ